MNTKVTQLVSYSMLSLEGGGTSLETNQTLLVMTDHLLMLMAATNMRNCPPLFLKIKGWVLMSPARKVMWRDLDTKCIKSEAAAANTAT